MVSWVWSMVICLHVLVQKIVVVGVHWGRAFSLLAHREQNEKDTEDPVQPSKAKPHDLLSKVKFHFPGLIAS